VLTLRLKNIASNEIEETVFSDLGTVDKDKAQLDLASLADMFTPSSLQSPSSSSLKRSKSSGNLRLHHAAEELLDGRRRQQVAVLLKRAPIPIEALRASLSALALHEGVSKDALDLLLSLFAKRNDEEAQRFAAYVGDAATLGASERFVWECYRVPRLLERLPLLALRTGLASLASEAERSAGEVLALLAQLKAAPFKLLLSYVVDVANHLRAGGGAKVQGFQLSSLPKVLHLLALVQLRLSAL